MDIGIITGSGFYDFQEIGKSQKKTIKTIYGDTAVTTAEYSSHRIHYIARHGENHSLLPNMINHRANIAALKNVGVKLIIATSVMGIIDHEMSLAELLLFDDLFYPDNRLPGGEICTFFIKEKEPERGHYIFSSPFSSGANLLAGKAAQKNKISFHDKLVHGHSCGPRFNSATEIRMMKNAGCSTVSQTAGPEIVLAGEAEIGYCLLGFGIDYANGVCDEPTPLDVLDENMNKSTDVFKTVIMEMIEKINPEESFFDRGFVYRFE